MGRRDAKWRENKVVEEREEGRGRERRVIKGIKGYGERKGG